MADTRLLSSSPVELLKHDHDRIRELFQEHARISPESIEERDALFRQIRREIRIHGAMERDHFYPVLKDSLPAIHDDHVAMEGLLEKLSQANSGDKSHDALMKLLEESFTLHAAVEERDLFPRLLRLSSLTRFELTIKLENAREEIARAEGD